MRTQQSSDDCLPTTSLPEEGLLAIGCQALWLISPAHTQTRYNVAIHLCGEYSARAVISVTMLKNPGSVMRLIARTLFALCLFGLGSASIASVAEGEAAYNRADYRQAKELLEPYALAGNMHAQFLLGRMYANGEGVLQDYVRAHAWLNLAALYGHSEARTLRDRISPRMTPTQLAQAQSDARQFEPVPLPAPTRKKTASSSSSQSSAQASRKSAGTPGPRRRASGRPFGTFRPILQSWVTTQVRQTGSWGGEHALRFAPTSPTPGCLRAVNLAQTFGSPWR